MKEGGKKIRVLCLHGFQTNAKIMEYQIRHLRKFFNDMIDFDYLNGKYTANLLELEDQGIKKLLEEGDDVYSWVAWHSSNGKKDLLRDLKYVHSHLENHGPYDGLLGFSQGGGVINSLIQFHFSNMLKLKYLPKFVIIINAPFFHPPLTQTQISIPNIHMVSPRDTIVNDRALMMTTFYKSPLIVTHQQGHKVPKLDVHELINIKKLIVNAVDDKKISYSQIQPNL